MSARCVTRGVCLLLAAVGAGCASPDRWDAFDTETLYADLPRLDRPIPGHDDEPGAAATAPPRDEQGRLVLTVEQAAILALENNRDLRVRRLTPEIVATFEDIERGIFDPEFFGRAEILQEEAVEVSRARAPSAV